MAHQGEVGMRDQKDAPAVGPVPGHAMLEGNKGVVGGVGQIGEEHNL